jgi:hypothetical protein
MAMCLTNPTFAFDARLVSMAASAENLSAKRKDQHVSLSENEPIVGPPPPNSLFWQDGKRGELRRQCSIYLP